MLVHVKDCSPFVIQIVFHLLVIPFKGNLCPAPEYITIYSKGCLPSILRYNVSITKLPNICRSHCGSVGQHMDILSHTVVPGFECQVLIKRIPCRYSYLRTVIWFGKSSCTIC